MRGGTLVASACCCGYSCLLLRLLLLHSGAHPPFPLPHADEIKDDFDALGPDAVLQAVGNGTGEFPPCFI